MVRISIASARRFNTEDAMAALQILGTVAFSEAIARRDRRLSQHRYDQMCLQWEDMLERIPPWIDWQTHVVLSSNDAKTRE